MNVAEIAINYLSIIDGQSCIGGTVVAFKLIDVTMFCILIVRSLCFLKYQSIFKMLLHSIEYPARNHRLQY